MRGFNPANSHALPGFIQIEPSIFTQAKLSRTCAVMQTSHTFIEDIRFSHFSISGNATLLCLVRSHQASSVGVDAVGGVDQLGARFGVLRKLLVVVEPAVLGCREALVLQASQLRRRPHSHGLGDAAPRDYRFHCTQTSSDASHRRASISQIIGRFSKAAALRAQGRRRAVAHLSRLGVKVGSHPGRTASSALNHSTHTYEQ